jgi:glycosyltransferase involved in cell wall biosynthesis
VVEVAKGARAEAALAALAVARCHRLGLGRMLARNLPAGTACLNVGHSDLTLPALRAWKALAGARVTVMIHDTIALDWPQFQRPGGVEAFRRKLAAVSRAADLCLYVSAATRAAAERHLRALGRVPPGLVAPNGVAPARPDPAAVPPGLRPEGAYFDVLGTIEPRKNHALLLDVWDRFAAEGRSGPHLLILGRRGWNNASVFARLDAAAPDGLLRERSGLGDGAVAALLVGSRGLLMPSLAEGFGLPVAEAVALGVPVLAADLPVYRETVGDMAVYLDPTAIYSWAEKIATMSATPGEAGASGGRQIRLPTWEDHFNLVLTMT